MSDHEGVRQWVTPDRGGPTAAEVAAAEQAAASKAETRTYYNRWVMGEGYTWTMRRVYTDRRGPLVMGTGYHWVDRLLPEKGPDKDKWSPGEHPLQRTVAELQQQIAMAEAFVPVNRAERRARDAFVRDAHRAIDAMPNRLPSFPHGQVTHLAPKRK